MMLHQFKTCRVKGADEYKFNECAHDLIVDSVKDSIDYMFEVASDPNNRNNISKILTSLLLEGNIDESIDVLKKSAKNQNLDSWPVYDQLSITLQRLQNFMTGEIDDLQLQRIVDNYNNDLHLIKDAVRAITRQTIADALIKEHYPTHIVPVSRI